MLSLLSKKTDPYNYENGIDFKWTDVKEEDEDIALVSFIEGLQKQTDEEIFSKKVTEWLRYRTKWKEN